MNEQSRTHSQEWFNELKRNNPMQAAQTRKVLESTGNCYACSICGCLDTREYRLEKDETISHTAPTLRLCRECLGVQIGLHGEKLTPLDS